LRRKSDSNDLKLNKRKWSRRDWSKSRLKRKNKKKLHWKLNRNN